MSYRSSLVPKIAQALIACGIVLSVCAYGRDFLNDARRGEVKEFDYPKVKIGKTVYHIPPGGKIFNEHNMIIMPVAMPSTAQVMYRLDMNWEIRSLWLLAPEEIKTLGPAPKQ
ncbi:MAG: hypothetical protein EXR36_07825 [Betaproteobacteria bacterium]|nr:hypothetical protein [Betaproteobacteria bacterium]